MMSSVHRASADVPSSLISMSLSGLIDRKIFPTVCGVGAIPRRSISAAIWLRMFSSSRRLCRMFVATNSCTSFGSSSCFSLAFSRMIAILVSRFGIWTSASSPHPIRLRRRSLIPSNSDGGRSAEKTICFPNSKRSLKVLNSSS